MALLGMSEDIQDQALAEDDIEVWPENWTAVTVLLDMQTQWNIGMGGPVGLRYEALPVVLAARGIESSPDLFGQIRILESAALGAMRNGG